MRVLTARSGFRLQFIKAGKVREGAEFNRLYHDRGLAQQNAEHYRAALLPGETVEVVPVEEPIELYWQLQSVLTVIRVTTGDEFADQLAQIVEQYGERRFEDGLVAERQVHSK